MFKTTTLPASGGLARRLLSFAQLNGMDFDEQLADLALTDMLTREDIERLPFNLNNAEIAALQHVRDWKGRAMLLDEGHASSRRVSLANVFLKGGKTLIMVSPNNYSSWTKFIRGYWPDAVISLFGNPRYAPKGATYPEGISFTEHPNLEADFFVTSYSGVIWNDFVSKVTVDQTIVEEFDSLGSVNYKWADAVQSLFHELPAPLFLQNIYNLPNDNNRSNEASLLIGGSKALDFIGQTVTNYLWAGISTITPLTQGSPREVQEHLYRQGYANVDMPGLLGLFGVSFNLLGNVSGNKSTLAFFDDTVNLVRNDHSRRESSLRRFIDREKDLKHQQGLSVTQVVQSALDGDRPSQTLIGALKNTQWANLKAQHIKGIHANITNRTTRSLFLVENADLERGLRLQFGNQIESMVDDPTLILYRLNYPDWIAGYVAPQRTYSKLNNVIVTIDDLINHPILLQVSSFLFLADTPVDQEFYGLVKQAADQTGTQIIMPVIKGTFEEEIYNRIAEI